MLTAALHRLRHSAALPLAAAVAAAMIAGSGVARAQGETTPPPAAGEGGTTPPATPPTTTPPAEAVSQQPIWFKICETPSNVCYLQADLVYEGTLVGSLRIDHSGLDQPLLRMLWPLGVLLRPNFAYAVDPGTGVVPDLTEGRFIYCGPLPGNVVGCLGEGPVGTPLVDQLRAGEKLLLMAFDRTAQPVTLEVGLTGFAAAYDGPAAQTVATGRRKRPRHRNPPQMKGIHSLPPATHLPYKARLAQTCPSRRGAIT